MTSPTPGERWLRWLLAGALLLQTPVASAHGAMAGGSDFFNGLFHPLMATAHLCGLVAVGLMAAQQGLSPRALELLGLIAGLLAGAWLASPLGDPDTDRVIWLLSVATALGVVLGRRLPSVVRLGMPACIGLAIGLGSGDPTLQGVPRLTALAGSLVGAMLLASQIAVWIEAVLRRWPAPVIRIGLRVLASWLTACCALLLALAWRHAG